MAFLPKPAAITICGYICSVDDLTIPSKLGKGVLRRVPEVFDCWFESGSMPYAQQHYPFEKKKEFEDRYGLSGILLRAGCSCLSQTMYSEMLPLLITGIYRVNI